MDELMFNYATKEYVQARIAEAMAYAGSGGGGVDLSAFEYACIFEDSGATQHFYGKATNPTAGHSETGLNAVTKIIYEDSIKTINTAPYNATNLSQIVGGNNVEVLEAGANGFRQCTSLTSVYFPHLKQIANGAFRQCTALQSVEFGSIGYGLTPVSNILFQNCTQAELAITFYSTGANVDDNVSKIRNGATNATIVVKASENTTYGGNSYAAGDTILTSTP